MRISRHRKTRIAMCRHIFPSVSLSHALLSSYGDREILRVDQELSTNGDVRKLQDSSRQLDGHQLV